MPRDQGEDEDDGDEFEGVGVFAEETETDQQPGGEPETVCVRSPLERDPEREHGADPEKDRKRIDRHDEIADTEKRDGIEADDGPEGGALVEKAPGEIIEQQGCRRPKERAP